ncbi:MAG TPA: hypothetical protein VNJ04_05055 [Gemmatimonadaceae bacterium]|nr:hypothetical protein [Gemmatimonadaceae bacterium]
MPRAKALPWRVQSGQDGGFDELVVGMGMRPNCLIHAEMMDERSIFVTVAGLRIWAHVGRNGKAVVTHTEQDPTPQAATSTRRQGKER